MFNRGVNRWLKELLSNIFFWGVYLLLFGLLLIKLIVYVKG